jgi:UDP-glucuronate decarboxylase
MKILVTGAAGFLASHLVPKLLNSGHQVIGIDDLSTGSRANLPNHRHFIFHQKDIRNCKIPKVDVIYNLASPASPVHYQINPIKTFETNVLGVMAILRSAAENGSIVIQASTSEVYGDPLINPQSENYWGNVNTIGPRSCYDESKRASETICFDYIRQYNVDVRIARIFNTYGPNMAINDGRVVSNFIVQAKMNQPLTIYGNGKQTRSLCYVTDLIQALFELMMNSTKPDIPINLGNPQEISMNDLASKIIHLSNSSSKIVYMDLPIDDPKQRQPDISRARKLLKWEPKITLEEGLLKTIRYFETVMCE